MELEHQTQEAQLLGSTLERHHQGITEMLRGVSALSEGGSDALRMLGGKLNDVER